MTVEGKMLFSISLMASCRRMGSRKGLCEMVDYSSTQKKGFKGAWLEFEINVSCCFLLPFVSILFCIFKKQKHNDDDAYLNNKHRKTFFYNFNMFGAAVKREIIV